MLAMASGTLYTYPDNFRAYKVLIAAQYSGAKVQSSSNFKFGETNKSEEFLKKFPVGKVPAFESNDGKCISESNAIAHFVGNQQLRGKDALDQSLIQQWISYGDNEIIPAMCTWVFPCMGIIQYNKQNTERAKEDIQKALKVLNDHLLTRTFLVGERITLADVNIACNLLSLYQKVLEPKFREAYGNVNRWFTTLVNQPEFKKVLGDVKLCSKMAQFDAQKFNELHGKAGAKGADKKKDKPAQEKKAPKPKQEKKKEPEEDDDMPVEPKKKDPFADVPKGNFDFDDFKRKYSNFDTKESVPYFWEKIDRENYSIWYCEYKYHDELTKVFMTMNLVSGMMQRIDKLRKNAFANMVVSGVDNDNTITGIWVFRGQELAFTLSPDWGVDYESYSWKKLDINAPETKEIVDKYFVSDDKDKYCGKIYEDSAIFK